MAATVEDASGVDHHAWGMNLAGHHALGFNLDATFGENHAIEPPGNHDAVPFNLALDFGAFAKDDRLLRDDVPFYVAVNAERTRDRKRSLKRHALVDETCPLFVACALWCCTGPLPRHGNPPRKDSSHSSRVSRQVNAAL